MEISILNKGPQRRERCGPSTGDAQGNGQGTWPWAGQCCLNAPAPGKFHLSADKTEIFSLVPGARLVAAAIVNAIDVDAAAPGTFRRIAGEIGPVQDDGAVGGIIGDRRDADTGADAKDHGFPAEFHG